MLSDIFILGLTRSPLLRLGEERIVGSRNECQAGRELSLVIFRDLVDREWVFPADPQGAKYRGVHRCI